MDKWVNLVNEQISGLDDNYWHLLTEGYLSDSAVVEANDKIYGKGAAAFVGKALKAYWSN